MFKKIKRLLSFRSPTVESILTHPEGKRYYREKHNLRRDLMDEDALKVVSRLNRKGYRSYLVGGCVRDMMLGRRPKDFDVVTTATPSQIRNLFSNSRVIGRRFKIVHIIFKGKVIEVSTFRSLPAHRLSGKQDKDADLLMHRDNQYGAPQEDAARRDFTINALFFDPRNESIIDYVGGFDDIRNKKIVVIGDPGVSFKEDPVRMLRAAKFAALLDFKISGSGLRAIQKHKGEIAKASPSRMFEEYIKIFRTGHAAEIFTSFSHTGLLKALLPEAYDAIESNGGDASKNFPASSMGSRLYVADRTLTEHEDLTVNIFFALLLADIIKDVFQDNVKKNVVEYIKARLLPVCKRMNIPGKDTDRLVQIYASQHRFTQTRSGPRFKPEFFRKKIFFYEAFMVYKIMAIASGNDDDAIQKAMFWEIGPRMKPPETNKIINLFGGRRNFNNNRNRNQGGDRKREKSSGERSGGEGGGGSGRRRRPPRGASGGGKPSSDGNREGGRKRSPREARK